MQVLIHCVYGKGGLAEHVHYQAKTLFRRGEEVVVLCPDDFLSGRNPDYTALRVYRSLQNKSKPTGLLPRSFAIVRKAVSFLKAQWRLAWEIHRRKPDFVLLDSYAEYLAPLWVWPHLVLAKLSGVTYVCNLHDPVRDFIVGPRWWHDWSVRLAYAPIKICVVHQHLTNREGIPAHVAVVEAPVGVYDLQETGIDARKTRKVWGVQESSVVFLAFGFIRDNKNVDLLIRALQMNPEAVLVVMGSAQSSTNKPLQFYRDLASSAGVSERVIFHEQFVPDEALAGYFAAADFIAVTYDRTFHSQSGVLNVAARARRPVLASAGESPLKTSVLRFRLGEFVPPDSLEAVSAGMKALINRSKEQAQAENAPDWKGYIAYASWESNVSIVIDAVKTISVRK